MGGLSDWQTHSVLRGLVCAARLDGEYPLHRDKVLAVEVHKQQAVVLLELLQLNADSCLPHGTKDGITV